MKEATKPPTLDLPRVAAIDVMRGLVMVIMSIDHASEVFNSGRLFTDSFLFFKPGTPLPAAQFFTRWITHLCAPTFVALVIGGGVFFGGKLIVAYPVLLWLGIMCLGWAFGRRLVVWRRAGLDEIKLGSRALAIAGTLGLGLFVGLRAANGFGNMRKLGVGSAYVGALVVVVVLYPACRWYQRYKAAHPAGWARWV